MLDFLAEVTIDDTYDLVHLVAAHSANHPIFRAIVYDVNDGSIIAAYNGTSYIYSDLIPNVHHPALKIKLDDFLNA